VDRKGLPAPQSADYPTDRDYVAPRDAVEKKLAALWEEVLGVRPVGVKTGFFDLGGKSLLAARLFMKIIKTFGKELPLTTLIHAPTVELLAKELRPSEKGAEYPTLVAMRRRGTRPPFFCVHGGAGSTLFLHRLAQRMGPNQPFYGIEPEGLDGGRFQRTTIEQMAAHYLSEIRKVQPAGPYYLGGYCFGGIVAFEMAQQLRRQGEVAALVALFTADLRYHRKIPFKSDESPAKPAHKRLATLLKSPMRALYGKGTRLVVTSRERLAPIAYKIWFRLGRRIPPSMRTLYVWRTLLRAEQNYVPQPHPGTLVLFHGADYENDPNLGWDGLAARLEHRVIGTSSRDSRRDLMNEPLVSQTAAELAACITRASDGFVSPTVKSA
jgi:pimeloyl-ACP methyl ester carboxylesterase